MPKGTILLAIAAFLGGCAAMAPQQAIGPVAAPAEGSGAARALTRTLFSNFHERIVEAEEHRSGPGAVLTHVSLYERPQTTHLQGLCEVVVHDVGVPFSPPPNQPPMNATSVRTGSRYYSIGEVGPSIPPASQERDCAMLSTATNFFAAPSRETAHSALQTYWSARRWAANGSREAIFECSALNGACPEPRTLLGQMLTPDMITAVDEAPCEPRRPGRGTQCFTYHLDTRGSADPSGPWTVSIKGPERPVHVRITQTMYPVS